MVFHKFPWPLKIIKTVQNPYPHLLQPLLESGIPLTHPTQSSWLNMCRNRGCLQIRPGVLQISGSISVVILLVVTTYRWILQDVSPRIEPSPFVAYQWSKKMGCKAAPTSPRRHDSTGAPLQIILRGAGANPGGFSSSQSWLLAQTAVPLKTGDTE